jgi:hypothetical protein
MTHEVTVTGNYDRIRHAIEDEIGNHWRTLQGLCQCGRSRSKDSAQVRAHMAEEIMAVLLRFQPGQPREDPIGDEMLKRFGPGTPKRPQPPVFCEQPSPVVSSGLVPPGTPCSLTAGHIKAKIAHHASHDGHDVEWLTALDPRFSISELVDRPKPGEAPPGTRGGTSE